VDIFGHWLDVKQGSYQAMWSQHNSCCGAKERRTTRQISGEWEVDFFLEVFKKGRLNF